MADEEFTHDVFISCSSQDSEVVLSLAERLREDGLEVWLDAWGVEPGTRSGAEIQRALEASRVLLVCMSPAYFASEWPALALKTLPFRDSGNSQRRFVPVLLEDCALPEAVTQFFYIDWRYPDADAYEKIVASCRTDGEDLAAARALRTASADELGVTSVSLANLGDFIEAAAFTPDGKRVVWGASTGTLQVWDVEQRQLIATLGAHKHAVRDIAISLDGTKAISCSGDQTLMIWDLERLSLSATLKGHGSQINAVAMSRDGKRAVSGADSTVKVWDLEQKRCVTTLTTHKGSIYGVAISDDGKKIVSSSSDNTIQIRDLANPRWVAIHKGHSDTVTRVRITPDGRKLISSSCDGTLKIWDMGTQLLITTLEGHSGRVWSLAVSADGKLAVSGASDETIRIWDLEAQVLIAAFNAGLGSISALAISADGRRLVSGSFGGSLTIWEHPSFAAIAAPAETARYTNAKVCLVGESGVGKSGLALRLAELRWQETGSTHGMTVAKLDLPALPEAGMEREVWLWDFAGQPDYRLVHQLYMDETALALMVIDAQKDQPFEPLAYWEQALSRAVGHDPAKLLVAARCDRGGYTIGQRHVDDYMASRDYAGQVNTAAKLPDDPGCTELRRLIAKHIPWDRLPSTSTTKLF